MGRLFSIWLALLLCPLAVLLPVLVFSFVWERTGALLSHWFDPEEDPEVSEQE